MKHHDSGEICTNRCPEKPNCTIQKSSILLEAVDILTSENVQETYQGVYVTSFVPYCVSPEAYENGII